MIKKLTISVLTIFLLSFSSLLIAQCDSAATLKKGLYLHSDIGRLLGEDYGAEATYFTLNTEIGYAVFPFLYTGVGSGVEYINLKQTFPLYGMIKFIYPKPGIRPMVFFKGGYALPHKHKEEEGCLTTYRYGGGLYNLGVGVMFPMNKYADFTFTIASRHEKLYSKKNTYYYWSGYSETVEITEIFNRIEFKVGLILM